jgi:hypothetical protein
MREAGRRVVVYMALFPVQISLLIFLVKYKFQLVSAYPETVVFEKTAALTDVYLKSPFDNTPEYSVMGKLSKNDPKPQSMSTGIQ